MEMEHCSSSSLRKIYAWSGQNNRFGCQCHSAADECVVTNRLGMQNAKLYVCVCRSWAKSSIWIWSRALTRGAHIVCASLVSQNSRGRKSRSQYNSQWTDLGTFWRLPLNMSLACTLSLYRVREQTRALFCVRVHLLVFGIFTTLAQ